MDDTPAAGHLQKEKEFITASEPTPKILPEVKDAGVEEVKDALPLTEEHKALGIEHAKESTPVVTEPSGIVGSPLTKAQAKQIIKMHKKIADSIVWLAMLVLKQFKIIQRRTSRP